jgi:predicted RNase H-like HicB family nuclease
VGEGDSYDEALADVESAIKFHVESFGALNAHAANLAGLERRAQTR